ncbi:MAG: hypothetical protein ACK2T3_14025 [Candidatus Promineifilaceae bacterium]
MNRKRLRLIFTCVVLILLLVACSQDQLPGENSDTAAPAAPVVSGENTPATDSTESDDPQQTNSETSPDLPTLESKLAPTVGPPQPSILASRQVLGDDGRLVIDQVVAVQDGWIVVYADNEGQKGDLLGYAGVSEGSHEGVSVSIDPLMAGDALYIALHDDQGEKGSLELPDIDSPIEIDGLPVEDQIRIFNQATIPEITISDQEVLSDGIVSIDLVAAARPGWIALHLDEAGEPGKMAAYAPVEIGRNRGLEMVVNWREATPTLHAVLYEDSGEFGTFEDESIDRPVRLEGELITTTFEARYPPDIVVANQPVIDDKVVIERAVSYGPGWLVVYYDEEGQIGLIIGQAPLEDGINENVEVPIIGSAATPILHLMLHDDTGEIGQFEFPIADPMTTHQGIVPLPISFRTDAGNYLITSDQQVSEDNTVTIRLIVAEQDAWVVIYNDVDGEMGTLLGRQWIPAGLHRDIEVSIDPEGLTETLHAVLHVDAGTAKEFEYPDSYDIPFRRNSNIIDSPILILSE